jgi:hypothetical protein
VPLALKDVLCTEGVPTTVGSRILEGWRPPYDATVTARLKDAGVVLLGKTNMDEFAMGSSTEHSAYGPSHNPVGPRPHPRRLRRRLGRCGRRLRGAAGDRHRHRRLDPAAGLGHRHRRRQAHLRRRLALRPGGVLQQPRPGRPVRAHGARRRAAARRHRRARPARLHLHRRAGAAVVEAPRAGRRGPARRGGPGAVRRGLRGRRAGAVRRGRRAAAASWARRSPR